MTSAASKVYEPTGRDAVLMRSMGTRARRCPLIGRDALRRGCATHYAARRTRRAERRHFRRSSAHVPRSSSAWYGRSRLDALDPIQLLVVDVKAPVRGKKRGGEEGGDRGADGGGGRRGRDEGWAAVERPVDSLFGDELPEDVLPMEGHIHLHSHRRHAGGGFIDRRRRRLRLQADAVLHVDE